MGCFSSKSDAAPPTTFKSPSHRKCTDMLFCILFAAFIIGMFVVTGYAADKGNYKRLTNGLDFRGCTCDTTVGMSTDSAGNPECVETDANAEGTNSLGRQAVFVEFPDALFGADDNVQLTCGEACPTATITVCYPESRTLMYGDGSATQQDTLCTEANILPANCAAWAAENCGTTYTSSSLFGYCIPSENDEFIDRVENSMGDVQWTQVFDSISNGWLVILSSLLVALVLGYFYLYMLEKCAKPLTYFAMLFILATLVIGGIFLWQRASEIKDTYTGDNEDGYKSDNSWRLNFAGSIATFVMAGLFLCFICFMFKRIQLATKCVVKGGQAVRKGAPMLVFFAVYMVLLGIGITAAWAVTVVLLFSAGDVESVDVPGGTSGVLKSVSLEDDLRNSLYYMIFGYFWVTQFLVALVEIVVALAVTRWFFAPSNASGEKEGLPNNPVSTAFSTATRYHLGSVAFGALIIAIVKAIRAVFEYVTAKAEKAGQTNKCIKALTCCVRCCLCCLEACLRFINRQAYIQIAITGEPFCTSAKAAFHLIANNVLRYGALTVVSTIFLVLGRLFVAGGATLVAYGVLTKVDRYSDETRDTAVSNAFVVCVLVFLAAYTIGSLFMSLLSVAIDAMLQSAIIDEANPSGVKRLSADSRRDLNEAIDAANGANVDVSHLSPRSQQQQQQQATGPGTHATIVNPVQPNTNKY